MTMFEYVLCCLVFFGVTFLACIGFEIEKAVTELKHIKMAQQNIDETTRKQHRGY